MENLILTSFLQLNQASEFRGGIDQVHGDHQEVTNSSWAGGTRGKEHQVSTMGENLGPKGADPAGGDEEASRSEEPSEPASARWGIPEGPSHTGGNPSVGKERELSPGQALRPCPALRAPWVDISEYTGFLDASQGTQ